MLRASVGRVQPAAGPADDVAAARLDQNKVARREADAARRRQSRAADATATRSNVCGVWSACAAAEPADDAAAALHERKKVASRKADAARRRPSRAADATATLRCVWSGLCAARCVMCVGQAAAYVLCLVAPEMSGGPSLRCQYGIYIKLLCESPSSLHSPLHLHCPHTIVILVHDYCPIHDPPPAPRLGAIHHT